MTNDNSLFDDNISLAYGYANSEFKKYKSTIEYEDLRQLALLGLFKASKSFNPNLRV